MEAGSVITSSSPITFSLDGALIADSTDGVWMLYRSALGHVWYHGVSILFLQIVNRSKIFSTKWTFHYLFTHSDLVICPYFHTFYMNTVSTTISTG